MESRFRRNAVAVISVLLLIASLCFAVLTMVDLRATAGLKYIWIEAENASVIEYPVEIAEDSVETSGGRYIRIRDGAGSPLYGNAYRRGRATYRFNVAHPGEYVFWARVKWTDGCGNSLYFEATDVSGKGLYGEDCVYGIWHWVKQNEPLVLPRGGHEIVLSNSEDGVAVDEILLTNDPTFEPAGFNRGSLAVDFSDTTPSGWEPMTPARWTVRRDSVSANGAYYLAPSEVPTDEYSLVSNLLIPEDFWMVCRVKCARIDEHKRKYHILFDYQDGSNCCLVEFSHHTCRVVERRSGTDCVLTMVHQDDILSDTNYHDIRISRRGDDISVTYGSGDIIRAQHSSETRTGAQLGVGSGYGGLYVDDIRCFPIKDIHFSDNFYAFPYNPGFVDPWTKIGGRWQLTTYFESSFSYGVRSDTIAWAVAGEPYWKNYSFASAVRTIRDAGVGIHFYYQDRDNHYLFRMADSGSGKTYAGKRQLIKVADGKEHLLFEDACCRDLSQWSAVRADIYDDEITIYVGGEQVCSLIDATIGEGRVGLYVDPARNVHISDPEVRIYHGTESATAIDRHLIQRLDEFSDGLGITFFHKDDQNYYLFRWNSDLAGPNAARTAQLFKVVEGVRTLLAESEAPAIELGRPYVLSVTANEGNIRTSIDNRQVFDVDDSSLTSGKYGFYIGRDIDDAYFDDITVESIRRAVDDFDRSNGLLARDGNWDTRSGRWQILDSSCVVVSDGDARSSFGDNGWSNYAASVEAVASAGSVAGILAYFQENQNHYMFEWSACESGTESGMRLVKVLNGVETILASGQGGFQPGRPYRLGIRCLDGSIEGLVDDQVVLDAYDRSLGHGKAGLYSSHTTATRFDRLLISFQRREEPVQILHHTFAFVEHGRDLWSALEGRWGTKDERLVGVGKRGPAVFWSNDEYAGNISLQLEVDTIPDNAAGICLTLCGNKGEIESGYTLCATGSRLRMMSEGNEVCAVPVDIAFNHHRQVVRFEKRGRLFLGYVGGECLLCHRVHADVNGGSIGIWSEGGRMVINDIAIFAEPSGYYDFGFQGPAASQLADWSVLSGVWDIDVNDRCLSGQKNSDDNAWFRHRREFAGGDIVVRLRCKVCKPEDNGALFVFADGGKSVDNGYAFEIEAGSEERTVRLLRDGTPVAAGRLDLQPPSA
jgi:hypothetical protein